MDKRVLISLIILGVIVVIAAIIFIGKKGDIFNSNLGENSNFLTNPAIQRDCGRVEFSEWYSHRFGAKNEKFSCMSEKMRDCEAGAVTWTQFGDKEGWRLPSNQYDNEYKMGVIGGEGDFCIVTFSQFINSSTGESLRNYTCKYAKYMLEWEYKKNEGANKNSSMSLNLFIAADLDFKVGPYKMYFQDPKTGEKSLEINCFGSL